MLIKINDTLSFDTRFDTKKYRIRTGCDSCNWHTYGNLGNSIALKCYRCYAIERGQPACGPFRQISLTVILPWFKGCSRIIQNLEFTLLRSYPACHLNPLLFCSYIPACFSCNITPKRNTTEIQNLDLSLKVVNCTFKTKKKVVNGYSQIIKWESVNFHKAPNKTIKVPNLP